MNTNYTPGPWNVRFARNMTAIVTPKGEMQLSLHGIDNGLNPISVNIQEWENNARLIAAAPELLEALKVVLLRAENMAKLLREQGYGLHDAHDTEPFKAAREAIAKATQE
jgi:hypothetical protein